MSAALRILPAAVLFVLATTRAPGDDEPPSVDKEPFLRVEAGGPRSYGTALAFDPTGGTLYAAGWDKVVYVWRRDPRTGRFVEQPGSTYRVPIGPGLHGAINAMSVSPDGRWLAVAGHGVPRGGAGFRQPGRVLPSEGVLTPEMRLDEGMIYVFDTRDRSVRPLRGHAGSVLSMVFAPGSADTPVLVSAAREWREQPNGSGRFAGTVRVWDVLRGEHARAYIGGRYLPEPTSRPGLAARRLGPKLAQIQLAIAWGDEQFRWWDVAPNDMQAVPCGRYCITAAFLPSADGFVTGVFDRGGRLALRDPSGTRQSLPLDQAAQGALLIPRAIACGTGADRRDFVVAVSRSLGARGADDKPDKYLLQWITLVDGRFDGVAGRATLWDVPPTGALPAVAASPGAEVVAVVGDVDQSIWLYDGESVRQGGGPFQVLRGSGSLWQQVCFVRQGERKGLRLRGPSGQIVFDLDATRTVADATPWIDDASTARDWRIEPVEQEGFVTLIVTRGGREISRATMPEGETLSTHAFFAGTGADAAAEGRPAILAVASHQLGQAMLRLYNADSGEAFRQLTGHTQTVSSLSFSRDGRLLASVAGDQTVCLWSLADRDTIIARHGMLPGVAVRKTESNGREAIVVGRILETAPAPIRNALARGDVLRSLEVEGQERTWTSVREFFDAFWALAPATRVKLNVVRKGQPREITLAVGQGIDERKPMLSLFVTLPDERQRRQWIAWTPLGPYEASGRDAERYLGWHFNTPDPASPTRFAAADEYRGAYYREGLVKELVEQGTLEERRPDPPRGITMRFGPEAQQERTPGGAIRIRHAPEKLHLFLDDFPSQRVASVEVVADGRSVRDFEQVGEDAWIADVRDLDWNRGTRRFRAVVDTNETPPRQFTWDTTVEYLPLPPRVESPIAEQQVVEDKTFRLVADVESPGNEAVDVRVRQNGRLIEPVALEGTRVECELALQPGDNVVELLASNRESPQATRDQETTRAVFRVTYRKAKALPPKIALDRFESIEEGTGQAEAVWPSQEDGVLVVARPKLRVRGTIRADEPLTVAEWRSEKAPDRQRLEYREAAEGGAWQFVEEIDLEPGRQQFDFYARSADSDEASQPIAVDFRPPLPEVALDPLDRAGRIEREAGDPPVEMPISGTLTLPDARYPFDAQLMLNDEPIAAPTVDLDRATLSARVVLRGGENRIRVALRNRWGVESTSDTLFAELRTLPRVVDASHAPVEREPFTTVTAEVECPVDRPLAQVTVAGRPVDPAAWRRVTVRDDVIVWRVTADNVPLEPGKNAIEVVATNADGSSRRPKTLEVAYDAAQWAPASIEFLNAAPGGNVVASSYALQFRVRSASPPRSIGVEVNGVPLPSALLATEGPQEVAGQNQWNVTAELLLREGVSRVVVTVLTDGGEARAEREISYVPPPVRVTVASLEAVSDPTQVVRPVVRDDRLVFEEPLASGYARLRGAVVWHGERHQRAASAQVRVWVNGFQQKPVRVKSGAGEVGFETLVVLSEEKQNQVVLDLVGAPKDAQSRLAFEVDCLSPRARQRLHLLIVGVGQRDAAALRRRALEAVGAEADASGRFAEPLRSTVFYRINAYAPLTGKVTFSDVFRLLLDVRTDIEVPVAADASGEVTPINDVVMLYYEGGVLVPDKSRFMLSTSERYDPGNRFSAVSSEWLAKFFDSMRGAQLALLDVSTKKPPHDIPVGDWNHDSHAALLCYTWREGIAPPAELRLINAVQKALAATGRLGEVDRMLADLSAQSRELDYNRVLPESLKSLLITRR